MSLLKQQQLTLDLVVVESEKLKISIVVCNLSNLYDNKSFTKICTLSFQDKSHNLQNLMNTKISKYAFIDRNFVQFVCKMFEIIFVKLMKFKSLRAFDERRARSITKVIYLTFTIQKHFKLITSMFIIDIEFYFIILRKF